MSRPHATRPSGPLGRKPARPCPGPHRRLPPRWRGLAGAVLAASLSAPLARAAAAEPGMPSLGPLPHADPLPPLADDNAHLSPELQLQRRLQELIRQSDQRIQELEAKTQGLTSGSLASSAPAGADGALSGPLQERDQALQDLQRTLAAQRQAQHGHDDVLETARPAALAAQARPLTAVNQLRIGACYQQLITGGKSQPSDLDNGLAALAAVHVDELPDEERARYLFLHAWFLVEKARASSGAERDRLIAAAQDEERILTRDFPASELNDSAMALMTGLPTGSGTEDGSPASAPAPAP
jgi:hypothetical protein